MNARYVSLWPLSSCEVFSSLCDRLVGLVVKASTSRAEDPGLVSRLLRDLFSGSSHTSDLKIGTPVATLRYTCILLGR